MKFKVWDKYKQQYVKDDVFLSKDGEIYFLIKNKKGILVLKPAGFQSLYMVESDLESDGMEDRYLVWFIVIFMIIVTWPILLACVLLTKHVILELMK